MLNVGGGGLWRQDAPRCQLHAAILSGFMPSPPPSAPPPSPPNTHTKRGGEVSCLVPTPYSETRDRREGNKQPLWAVRHTLQLHSHPQKCTTPPPPPPQKIFLQRARHEWRGAQKLLLQRTTSKSHIGELAPMALCDIHVAGCGEHLPAWGLHDDRIPGTDQAVRGGHHGQKLHSGFPPRKVDARSRADAGSSTDACLLQQKFERREANRRRHRLTEPTTKALCQTPPPPTQVWIQRGSECVRARGQ